MKAKFWLLLILLLALSSTLFAQDYDVRKIRWGMSQAEVIKSEGKAPDYTDKDKGAIAYIGRQGGKDAVFFYGFHNDKVWSCTFAFKEKHSNRNDFISDYSGIKDILTKKYGEPTMDRSKWKNKLYQDDPEEWGFAVSLGHLFYFSEWKSEKSDISQLLSGDNYEIEHLLYYFSKELRVAAEKKEKDSETDGF